MEKNELGKRKERVKKGGEFIAWSSFYWSQPRSWFCCILVIQLNIKIFWNF